MKEAERSASPWLERWGLSYFRKLSAKRPVPTAIDEIHVLNADEREALRHIERGAVTRAAVAGAISALLAAFAELYADSLQPTGAEAPSLGDSALYWGIILGVSGVATIFEIAFLYWDGLRSVFELSRAAGLDLSLAPKPEEGVGAATALTRAALELPNPPDPVFDVDPRREASRLKLLVIIVAYKLKVSVTNFLMKTVFRRIAGRTALRLWAPFMAVPVTAAWNGTVTWWILRQARLRTMGASAAQDYVDAILDAAPPLSPEGKLAAFRAVGSAVVRTYDMHPNLAALLRRLHQRLGEPTARIDDSALFIEQLPTLTATEQDVAIRLLGVSAIIDGRVTGPERRLLQEAYQAIDRAFVPADIKRMQRAFAAGRELDLT